MTDLQVAPTPSDTGTLEVTHVLCCVDYQPGHQRTATALCGKTDDAWDEDGSGATCVACQAVVQAGTCPRYGRCTNQDTDIGN